MTSISRKIWRSYEKTNGILLPRKYLNFPSVKVIVSKIAYEIIKNTKNDHFLMAHYRKVVRENFFRVFGDIILVKSLFRTIRFINRTNSRPIWTRTGEERYHWKKVEDGVTVSPPKKKRTWGGKNFFFLLVARLLCLTFFEATKLSNQDKITSISPKVSEKIQRVLNVTSISRKI